MEVEDRNEGILIKPVKVIPSDQEYFYTKEWQKGESEAAKDISEGRLSGPFETVNDLNKELES